MSLTEWRIAKGLTHVRGRGASRGNWDRREGARDRDPQLILPMAFDQPDNAARVKSLGAGELLKSGRWKISHMVDALNRLMSDESRTCCRRVAERFHGDDALQTAAKLIEELAHRRDRPTQ